MELTNDNGVEHEALERENAFKKDIEGRFRSLTTLRYADIQLLKAGEYEKLAATLRNRFLAIMAVVAAGAGVFVFWEFRDELQGQVEIVVLAVVVLLWPASRLYKLSQIEAIIRGAEPFADERGPDSAP